MDGADFDFDADAAAMAQAMGFSSFGMQDDHPSKKRKYNPRADASTDAPAAHRPAVRPSPATGANAEAPRTNTDEINLDDDEEETGADISGTALAYVQTQIDEMIADSSNSNGASELTAQPLYAGQAAGAGNGFSLPNRPNPSWGVQVGSPPQPAERGGHSQGRGRRGGSHGQHGAGGDGKPWYDGYYDNRSNENPWQYLEKAAGLEPHGSWALKATTSG
ncbi:hypothetical protein F5X68DRAFT_276921 [Plectosphaerella plurivora]|uniref:Uncharacterized protein n=1 Tax=Plectosphaerella plurivora TaxID=936078 RepID=A0A9P9A9A4_9PEZI|nr:hypothetical protein F5X68DRAFT_276921 [Plectosphaerella plurivora]